MENIDRQFSKEEFRKLIIQYRNGDHKALETLVKNSVRMVKSMSRKYYGFTMSKHVPIEDLEQECYVALLGAVNNFPVDVMDNDFVSFAFSAMNYQILNYIRFNSNRIDKYDLSKGLVEFESIDLEKNSFGELADPSQEALFEEVESRIDHEINQKIVHQMLSEILNNADDVSLLKDIYNLEGRHLSFSELCEKYNISFSELVCKERLLVLKLKHSRKLQKYLEKIDYTPKCAFCYGVGRFKNTTTSSTEYIALKHIEIQSSLEMQGIQ